MKRLEEKTELFINRVYKTDMSGRISRRIILLASSILIPFTAEGSPKKYKSSRHFSSTHSKGKKSFIVNNKAPAVIGRAKPPLPLVFLDPGHGGKDPGAIGKSGTYEKHIAYAAAQELYRQLLYTGRYRVRLTRNADRFIPLNGRVEMAQQGKANLFISMHADALQNSSVRGASVYTLSSRASDAQTASLANVENSADRFGGPAVHATSPAIQKILASLVTEETKRESVTLAKSVVTAFRPRVGLLQNPRRHAAFVVLKSADIPSILVEMGFMSNQMDEAALRRSNYRAVVVSAMRDAIDRYFAIGGSLTHLTG